jgi:pimeloyl-ACP methyl ester carboxylesterase
MRRSNGFSESDGERIYYESVGEREPALVLCHGAGGNHAVWYQQVPVFARHRRVISWDQRGFGRSSARGGPTSPAAALRDLGADFEQPEAWNRAVAEFLGLPLHG